MFWICLYLFVCANSKSNERIFLKLLLVKADKMKKCLNFGKDQHHILGGKISQIFKLSTFQCTFNDFGFPFDITPKSNDQSLMNSLM